MPNGTIAGPGFKSGTAGMEVSSLNCSATTVSQRCQWHSICRLFILWDVHLFSHLPVFSCSHAPPPPQPKKMNKDREKKRKRQTKKSKKKLKEFIHSFNFCQVKI